MLRAAELFFVELSVAIFWNVALRAAGFFFAVLSVADFWVTVLRAVEFFFGVNCATCVPQLRF